MVGALAQRHRAQSLACGGKLVCAVQSPLGHQWVCCAP